MAHLWPSRVRETTTTTGTGTYTLAGAVTGYRTFAAVLSNGDTVDVCIRMGANWELGRYTFNAGTLARTAVLASSNADAAVDWVAGTKDIFAIHIGVSDLDATGIAMLGTLLNAVGTDGTGAANLFPQFSGTAQVKGLTAAAFRAALDLEPGTDFLTPAAIAAAYQPLAAALTSLASATANGIAIATAANYAAMRGLLDVEPGTDFLTPAAIAAAYQPLAAALTSLAGASANGIALATAANYAAMRGLLDLEPGVDFTEIPTTSTLPIGGPWMMRYTSGTALTTGSTTAGSNVRTVAFTGDFGSLGLNIATGAVQTGTWRNVNGTTLQRISSDNDGEQVGLMTRIS